MQRSEETTPRWRERRSTHHLGRRLLILYVITAAAVAAVFTVALMINWASMLELSTTTARIAHAYRDLSALQTSERNSNLRLLGYLSNGDDATLLDYRASLTTRQRALDQVASTARDDASLAAVTELGRQFDMLDSAAAHAIAQRNNGTEREALNGWQIESRTPLVQIERQITVIEQAQERAQDDAAETGQRSRVITILLTFIFATATALLGLWIVRRVILSITRPLEALATAAAAIGAGQLETRVAAGLSSEFDMLGGVMNTMAARLAESRDALHTALVATERRNHELHLLSAVGDALDSSLDLGVIIDRSLDVVCTAFGAQGGAIALYDEDGERWHWHDRADNDSAPVRPAIRELAHRAIRELTPDQEQLIVAHHDHTRTLTIMPLDTAVRTRGLLALLTAPSWQPDERERALLGQVSGQIARAIENVRLYVAEKGRSAEAGMLAQMAQLTTGTLDPDRLVRLIARYAVHSLGVDRCIVGFFDPRASDVAQQTVQRLYQYGFQPHQTPLGTGDRERLEAIVQHHMLEGQMLVVTDAADDERPAIGELARALGSRSFISVPLMARERRLGVIYLDIRAPRQQFFGAQDRRILAAIADQAAAALDGARLYEAERRRGAQLLLLNQTSQQIVASAQLDTLFAGVAATLQQTLGYEAARIGLLTDGAMRFIPTTEREQRVARATGEDIAWVLGQHGVRRFGGRDDAGGRRGLLVPLTTKTGVIGVLEVVAAAHSTPLDTEDERTLLALADQLATAVERSRLQERALSLAVVEERNRLARDLHDSVTQSLFSMNLTIEAARMLLDRDTAAAAQQLTQLRDRTQQTLAEMRDLIHSLRPSELSEQGLVVALRRWGERIRHEHLLPVEVQVEGLLPLNLSEQQERELFRIAQEALNNVIKHAAASRAIVRLRNDARALSLLIEDDGHGFDPDGPLRSDAFGTRGMRERAALLGGAVVFDSQTEGGTRVVVTIEHERALTQVS
jgi:nitrate/nitrite-specific signal transduction histidine kinase